MNIRSCSPLVTVALTALAVFALAQAPQMGQRPRQQPLTQQQAQAQQQSLAQYLPVQQNHGPNDLVLNDKQYFERQGVNVMVFIPLSQEGSLG